jgi:two-component system, chemotaxis family, protein-glutamate methylesterase/glutaminase
MFRVVRPPPAADPWLIVIAASAGGIAALKTVLSGLPRTIPAAIVIVQHRPAAHESMLDRILARVAHMPVKTAQAGDIVTRDVIYVSRPDLHLTVGPNRRFAYVDGTRVRGVRSSANPLFESAASAFGDRAIAVVLTGSGFDATDGVQAIKAQGGIVIVQDPTTAAYPGMPRSALRTGVVNHVLPLEAIAPTLIAITAGQQVGNESALDV